VVFDPINSGTLYIGTWGSGVYKSVDGGATWNAANSGMPPYVQSLTIDSKNSQVLYAGIGGGYLYKSINGGTSWYALSNGLPAQMSCYTIVIDPTDSNIVYAGDNSSGIYKTTDGGASWNLSNTGLTHTDVLALAIDPTNNQTIYAGTDSGLFKSINGGLTWIESDSGIPIPTGRLFASSVQFLAIDPSNNMTIYAATNSGIFKSGNGGSSWSAINNGMTGMYARSIAIDPTNTQTVYVGTCYDGDNKSTNGVFKSTDGGASWYLVSSNAFSGLSNSLVLSLAIAPLSHQTLYVGTFGNGVIKGVFDGLDIPTISGTPPLSATVGAAYSFTPTSNNTTSFSCTGTLPQGLIFNTSTGAISGIPTTAGIYNNIVITANNINGSASLSGFSINVLSSGGPISAPVGGLGMTLLTTLAIAGYGYRKSRK
jgi:photosystem II stability/assembly factor-like uncharacterized protein